MTIRFTTTAPVTMSERHPLARSAFDAPLSPCFPAAPVRSVVVPFFCFLQMRHDATCFCVVAAFGGWTLGTFWMIRDGVGLRQPGLHDPVREQGQTRLQRRVSAARQISLPESFKWCREGPSFLSPFHRYYCCVMVNTTAFSFPRSTIKIPVAVAKPYRPPSVRSAEGPHAKSQSRPRVSFPVQV